MSDSVNTQPWRLRWISEPLLKMFRRATPTMSQTEREALDAGSVWWDGELFSGRPKWKKLRSLPVPTILAEEQVFIDGPVEELCKMLDDWQITNEQGDLSPEAWQYIKDNGFFGMIIPKSYGGLDYSALAHSSVVLKIATRSITAAVSVMVPNSLGPAKLLLEYGTDEQKDYYLPRLAKGQEIPCFALTSPHAGSDAGGIPDYGIICRQDFQGQKDVLGMRVTWEKRYITLGPVATLLGLAFKAYDPEHLLGEEENLGITLALIPTDTEGVNIGRRHKPLNIPFMNGPNSGKDVFVPFDWIIGGQDRIGQGWRMLMECLADGRSISLPALSTGAGKLAARSVGAYARIRRQFKLPIGRFEGVEEALARIGGYTYMMDAARTLTAQALDRGEKPSVISAIVKYHLTESMRKVINDAMDVLGGAGICLGPRNLLGRVYQAIPISITVEGANILTRSMIIFGQGAIRSHPYIFKELEAIGDDDQERALKKFDRVLFRHIRFFILNSFRSLFHGLTGSFFIFIRGPSQTKRYYQHLTRMSAAFALLTDTAMMTLGGSLKRREKLSARLGDILSYLYLASATLKRFEDQGTPKSDRPMLHWVCQHALHEIQKAIDELLENFPSRPIAFWLHWMVFPLGKHFSAPGDNLGHQVAEQLLLPSNSRDRLTDGIYLPTSTDEAVGRLEDALNKVIQADHAERKLYKGLKGFKVDYHGLEGLIEAGLEQGILSEQDA
ncbi:MAG: acyl-CoA dehydrogenase, partial [Gammaproteobacteria bacterium]|nr:acyl-CoA dehydrogenase [Gammaproteobacteria bacterium]